MIRIGHGGVLPVAGCEETVRIMVASVPSEQERDSKSSAERRRDAHRSMSVSLLTGGSDKPYVVGLTGALRSKEISIDLIGSDELNCDPLRNTPGVRFLNLRGDQRSDVGIRDKVLRILKYYAALIGYAAAARPRIFHILWNNKFEYFDRTLLMLYYRMLGKSPVFTAHNINTAKRDSKDSWLNRLTLRTQYRLAKHIFVHTEKMKQELSEEFQVPTNRISVIPFGINNAVPNTSLTPGEAKARLGLAPSSKTILFFGRITPYKGLEYLIAAFRKLAARDHDYRLVIAGRPDRCEEYWSAIRNDLRDDVAAGRVLLRATFIPDEETESYFKGTDVLVLPYREIYQSGVLFLGHSFGLPVIAADVGSLKDDIVDGKTGFVFKSEDVESLAETLERYFGSDLYADLDARRPEIQEFANKRHSWDVVANITLGVYADLLKIGRDGGALGQQSTGDSRSASSTLRCAEPDVDCAPIDVQ